MTDAVIFSSFVHPQLMHRGEKYLHYLLTYFGDCDIYCGINYGTDLRWLDLIETYKAKGLKIEYKYVAPSLHSTSDNAGYQAALSLYKMACKSYENVYFTHTKSITHPDKNHNEGVEHMVISFHKSRERMKRVFSTNSRIGGWSAVGRVNYEYAGLNKVDEYYKFPFKAFEQTFVLTSFIVRASIINSFVFGCNDSFFLKTFEQMGYNRYFFEFYFPTIISKMGYIPIVDEFWDCTSQKQAREEMRVNFEKWKSQSDQLSFLEYPDMFEGVKPWM